MNQHETTSTSLLNPFIVTALHGVAISLLVSLVLLSLTLLVAA